MKIHICWNCFYYAGIKLIETERFRVFLEHLWSRRCVTIVKILFFQCWGRKKLSGQLLPHPPPRRVGYCYPFPKGITVCYYFVHHSFSSYTMYTSFKCLVWLVLPSNALLPCFFQDNLSCAVSGFAYDIDLASVAGIFRICKLAVMKRRGRI